MRESSILNQSDAVAASLIRSDDCKYALLLDASIASTTKVSDFVEEFGDDNFNEPEYPDDSQDMGEDLGFRRSIPRYETKMDNILFLAERDSRKVRSAYEEARDKLVLRP